MKTNLSILAFLFLFLVGCQKNEIPFMSPEKKELAKTERDLISSIQKTLNLQKINETVTKIVKVDYFDKDNELKAIVTYQTNLSEERNIGIFKQFGKDASKLKEIHLTCNGNCPSGAHCSLVNSDIGGNPPNNQFDCSCSGCKMVVTIIQNTLTESDENQFKMISLAEESYEQTFGEKSKTSITFSDVNIKDEKQARLVTYTYIGENKKPSTFLIMTPKIDGLSAGGLLLQKEKTYEIDCTGSCDCRERYNFNTNTSECTCSPCKMKVTEITNAP